MSYDADPVCYTWDLDESVLEEDNVEIPTDDNLYFYIKILFRFTCLYVPYFDDGESDNFVETWEEENSFLTLRNQLLTDDQAVVREAAISYMTRAMGAVPPLSDSITSPIIEMARSKAVTSGHMKVIPFSVQINVEDFVEALPDFESESSEEEIERVEPEEDPQSGSEEEEELNGSREVETCAICLDDVAVDGRRGTKKMECCKGVFHNKCINRWRRVKNLCPLCRSQIPN